MTKSTGAPTRGFILSVSSCLFKSSTISQFHTAIVKAFFFFKDKKTKQENLFDWRSFDVNSKTTNPPAVSLLCQKHQAHETAVALRLLVNLQPCGVNTAQGSTARRHLLCHPALDLQLLSLLHTHTHTQGSTERKDSAGRITAEQQWPRLRLCIACLHVRE